MTEMVLISKDELRAMVADAVREALGSTSSSTPTIVGWLTASEAAKALGVSRSRVWAWCCSGTIPESARITSGRTTRISARWIAGYRHAS